MPDEENPHRTRLERLKGLGLTGWATVIGMVAGIATIVALVVPLVTGDDDDGGSDDACAGAVAWSDVEGDEGESRRVRGPVVDATYAVDVESRPTYLNIGADYPDLNRFTVVIFDDDRSNFRTPPEDAYEGREVVVSGPLSEFDGLPQIVANDPGDITICDEPSWQVRRSAQSSPAASTAAGQLPNRRSGSARRGSGCGLGVTLGGRSLLRIRSSQTQPASSPYPAQREAAGEVLAGRVGRSPRAWRGRRRLLPGRVLWAGHPGGQGAVGGRGPSGRSPGR